MDAIFIIRLRELRRKARTLNDSLVADLKPFKRDDDTFLRLPYPTDAGAVNVSTTCTALMALAATGQLDELYGADFSAKVRNIFSIIGAAPWTSAGLNEGNPFTKIFVLRAAGFIAGQDPPSSGYLNELPHGGQTLKEIALELGKGLPDSLKVREYPAQPAMGYWYADKIDQLKISLDDDIWIRLAQWSSAEFNSQLSSVTAGHDAMMDPVSMVMAGCLTAHLRQILIQQDRLEEVAERLPSDVELRHAICELFRYQTGSGIWHKYFPLFHFDKAGANYCFSFEFLEALLNEFGRPELLQQEIVLKGLEKAVDWCEQNRLVYRFKGQPYCGWNFGGEIKTLRARTPESWATAMVHLFLFRLIEVLSAAIQDDILRRYKVSHVAKPPTDEPWSRLLDVDVNLPNEEAATVKMLIEKQIITPLRARDPKMSGSKKLRNRRSALLFGPPGTAKTNLVRAAASRLGWPCIEIHPSHFLDKGLEKIYVRANEIFEDLVDLSGVVVLFDEMDPLVQRREPGLDLARQFLTTSMLPKLAELYDRARVISFVNTNHRSEFDVAIMRPGRFDLLLCIGPPKWKEKVDNLRIILKSTSGEDLDAIRQKLKDCFPEGEDLRIVLDRFTFGEVRSLFDHLSRRFQKDTLTAALGEVSKEELQNTVRHWGEEQIQLSEKAGERSDLLEEYERDKTASRLQ